MGEGWQAGHGMGRAVLRRLCEHTVDLLEVGFGWVCAFTAAEARAVAGWLSLAGRGAMDLHPVADKVAASFSAFCAGGEILIVDRYVEAAIFLLDEVADSYPEHAEMVTPIAELLLTRLYSNSL